MNIGIISLWKKIFGDSEEYIRRFYDSFDTAGNVFGAYRDVDGEIRYTSNAVKCENENIIGLVNRIPMTIRLTEDYQIEGKYIFAGCIASEYRGRGLYRTLTERANEGTAFTALIPSEPWLFDLYKRLGYRPMKLTPYPVVLPASVLDDIITEKYDGHLAFLYSLYSSGIGRAFVEKRFFSLCADPFIKSESLFYIKNSNKNRIGYIIYEKTEENCIKIYDMYCPYIKNDGILCIEDTIKDFAAEKGLITGVAGVNLPPLNMLGEY